MQRVSDEVLSAEIEIRSAESCGCVVCRAYRDLRDLRSAATRAVKEMEAATEIMSFHPDDYFEALANLRAQLGQEGEEK